jgi:hypothetical protein
MMHMKKKSKPLPHDPRRTARVAALRRQIAESEREIAEALDEQKRITQQLQSRIHELKKMGLNQVDIMHLRDHSRITDLQAVFDDDHTTTTICRRMGGKKWVTFLFSFTAFKSFADIMQRTGAEYRQHSDHLHRTKKKLEHEGESP